MSLPTARSPFGSLGVLVGDTDHLDAFSSSVEKVFRLLRVVSLSGTEDVGVHSVELNGFGARCSAARDGATLFVKRGLMTVFDVVSEDLEGISDVFTRDGSAQDAQIDLDEGPSTNWGSISHRLS